MAASAHRLPIWVLVSALTAPVALLAGAILARIFHNVGYDPIEQTMSVLAGTGRYEWIMTTGFALSSVSQIITAAGLRVLHWPPRVALAFAGACGIVIAVDPETAIHSLHMTATGLGGAALAVFPALTAFRGPHAPRICAPRWGIPASIVIGGLLVWMGFELLPSLNVLGLAERVATVAALSWPLVVVVGASLPTGSPWNGVRHKLCAAMSSSDPDTEHPVRGPRR